METRQTDLARLLTGTKVFVIPQFQRHYKWKQSQWLLLFDDVVNQLESEAVRTGRLVANEGHFLGSIVLHPAPGPASTVSRYLVVDGQQRLTTLMALLAAARDLRAASDASWDPKTYDFQYLRNPYAPEHPHRLVSGDNDRIDFVQTIYERNPSGQVGAAYRWFARALQEVVGSDPSAHARLENAMLLRLLVVEINTTADDNVNAIFHTINHAGMKLTAIDLIRNYSFMQFEPAEADDLHATTWRPMELSMGGETRFSRYLWAQLVRTLPKTTQRDLYGPFTTLVEQRSTDTGTRLAVRKILDELHGELDLFELVENPITSPIEISDGLRDVIFELATWGSQTHVPLAMEFLVRVRRGEMSDDDAARALRLVLSYLVRRGLTGTPTNNLNRILSAIPSALATTTGTKNPLSALERELSVSSRYWPTDIELLDRGRTAAIALTLQPSQLAYVLGKLNAHMAAQHSPHHEDVRVAHVMPDGELPPAWRDSLAQHSVSVDTAATRLNVIGNLAIADERSRPASVGPEATLAHYRSSRIALNASLPAQPSWLPSDIDERSEALLRIAASVWPRPVGRADVESSRQDLLPHRFDIRTILDSMPGESVAFVDTIAELAAMPVDQVLTRARELGYPVLERSMQGREFLVVSGVTGALPTSDEAPSAPLSYSELIAAVEQVGATDFEAE